MSPIFNLDVMRGGRTSFTKGEYMHFWKLGELEKKVEEIIRETPDILKYWIAARTNVNPKRLREKKTGSYMPPYKLCPGVEAAGLGSLDWHSFDYIGKEFVTIDINNLRIGKKIKGGNGYRNYRFLAFCNGFNNRKKPPFYRFILSHYYKKGKEIRKKYKKKSLEGVLE